jgi:hypothetical protein
MYDFVNFENVEGQLLQRNMSPIHSSIHSSCNEFDENSLQWTQIGNAKNEWTLMS